MTFDPNRLSRLSSCLRCLTDAQLMIIRTHLMCRWLQNIGGGIIPTNARVTEDAQVRVTEDGQIRVIE